MTIFVVFVSLVVFILVIRETGRANRQSHSVQSDINSLNQQEQAVRKQAQDVQNSLTAEQLQTLGAAHELVERKRFYWSRLLGDLESALPGPVRVTRISVRDVTVRGGETIAELDLAVVSKAPSVITDMLAEMDRTGIFQAELRSQNLQKGRGESGTEYELHVLYRSRGDSTENKGASLAIGEDAASTSSGGLK